MWSQILSEHFIIKHNILTEQIISAIVCRRRHFLDETSIINRHVFVSNICRSSFRCSLQKQLIINVINVCKENVNIPFSSNVLEIYTVLQKSSNKPCIMILFMVFRTKMAFRREVNYMYDVVESLLKFTNRNMMKHDIGIKKTLKTISFLFTIIQYFASWTKCLKCHKLSVC